MYDFKRKNIETDLLKITPDIAQQLLDSSPGNRKIRQWHVDSLASAMSRGEWRVTSQGIGIDINGRLRDAHHRLLAVVQSGVTIESLVVMGIPENAYEVIDTGIKRNLSDILNENSKVTDILNVASFIVYRISRTGTIDQIRPIMESGLYDVAKDLIKFCSTNRAFFSSSPIRLAACLTVMNGGDRDYVFLQYKSLINMDFDYMSPITKNLLKQYQDGKTDSRNKRKDAIARGLKVFDEAQKNQKNILIFQKDIDNVEPFVLKVLGINPIHIDEPDPDIPAVNKESDSHALDAFLGIGQKEVVGSSGYVHRCGE